MTEFPVVLVINCGSSSIKFSVLDVASCDCLLNGVAEGINAERASLSLNGGEPVALAQRGYEGALQVVDLCGQQCNLNFGRTAVVFATTKLRNDFCFSFNA